MAKVAVLKTRTDTVLDDYSRLMNLAEYKKALPKDKELILKLNLSWSLYYPACSTEPWQLEGVLKEFVKEGYNVHPVENRTVVTDVWKGAKGNKWLPILDTYGLKYEPLTETKWVDYKPKGEMLALDDIYPGGHKIPETFIGKSVCHMPTVKCVHPDTEIFLADGSLVKIRDVVEKIHGKSDVETTYELDQVAENIEQVISLDDNASLKSALSYKFWKTPVVDNIYKIVTKTGREVKVSSSHPFLTPSGWRKSSELVVSDRIAVPRKIRVNSKSQKLPPIKRLNHSDIDLDKIKFRKGHKYSIEQQKLIIKSYISGKTTIVIANEFNTHYESIRKILKRYGVDIRWRKKWLKVPEFTSKGFWKWYGYFTAEGYACACNGSMRFWWSNNDQKLVNDYMNLTEELFGIKPKVKKDKVKDSDSLNKFSYYFDSNHLAKFFESMGVSFPLLADTKIVPPILFKCPEDEICAFLEGYLDGDGTVVKDGLHATTKSLKLVKGLLNLFLRIGCVAFRNDTYCRATNSDMEKQLYYKISVYGDELVNFSRQASFLSVHKQSNMQKLVDTRLKGKFPSNWDTLPICPIEFRKMRQGLGFTQESSGKPYLVNSIENKYSFPTKQTIKYFIDLFEKADKDGKYKSEILYLKFLASEDICWDYVEAIEVIEPDTDYLYDLSVFGTNNFIGDAVVLHNTHGHTQMTGAMKNAFGGLITERRHHCHKKIHEVLVDLLTIQKEIHPGTFAVMDGTLCGDGKGPRTMIPKIKNMILASEDQVAIDAISAKLMGFEPLKIPFIKIAHDRGLGCGDVEQIEVVGHDISKINFKFSTGKSPVIFFDQMFRKGALSFVEPMLFHTGLFKSCVFGSAFYHDYVWYNAVGKQYIKRFMRTPWGKLFRKY